MKKMSVIMIFVNVLFACFMLLPEQQIKAANGTWEGKCGPNVSWSYDKESATLTVSGKGEMTSCGWMNNDIIINSMRKAVIGEGVTSICHSAFSPKDTDSDYNFLEKGIQLPSTLQSIGDYAFAYGGLQKVDIPAGVTYMGKGVFRECTRLTTITLSAGITRIEAETFAECTSLKTVTLPSTVTYIGDSAYFKCDGLEKVILPEHVKELGNGVFQLCHNLKIVQISGISNLPCDTFQKCINLKTVTLPDCLLSIGDRAFQYCSKLEMINLPKELQSIGVSAFSGCVALKELQLLETVTSIGKEVLEDCVALKKIVLSGKLTCIPQRAFSDCISLKSIQLPDSIEKIEKNAFEDCAALKTLVIPGGVREIAPCHQNCAKLRKIVNRSGVNYPLTASEQVMNWYHGKKKVTEVKAGETVTGKGKTFKITYDKSMLKKYKIQIKGKLPTHYTYGEVPKLPQNVTSGKKNYCFVGWRYKSSGKKFHTGAIRTWYNAYTKKFSAGVKGNLKLYPMVCEWKIDYVDKINTKKRTIGMVIKNCWKSTYDTADQKENINDGFVDYNKKYQVRYADNKKMKKVSYSIESYGDVNVYKAKKGKTYYVQFREIQTATYYGVPYQTCWSEKIKIKIK